MVFVSIFGNKYRRTNLNVRLKSCALPSLCFYFSIFLYSILLFIFHLWLRKKKCGVNLVQKMTFFSFFFSLCQHQPSFNAKAVQLNHQTSSIRRELSLKKLRKNQKLVLISAKVNPIPIQIERNAQRYHMHFNFHFFLSIDTFYHLHFVKLMRIMC